MKKDILIRADGGSTIGMGHIVRCLALAEMLKNEYNIKFVIQAPTKAVIDIISVITKNIIQLPHTEDFSIDLDHFVNIISKTDIVILDGYHFGSDYQKKVKNSCHKLVCIDDLHSWHHFADAIINHAEGLSKSDYSVESYTSLYLGLKYVLLRPPFLNSNRQKTISKLEKAFISMGAADFDNNTSKFAEALLSFDQISEIHLMLSSVNPHIDKLQSLIKNNNKIKAHYNLSADELADILFACDIVICPASSISLESCAIGTGIISGYTANNQIGILEGLMKNEVIINWGNLTELTNEQIQERISLLLEKPQLLNAGLINQKKLIDGKSPKRIRAVFKRLSITPLHFRFAAKEDTYLYFRWVNDPEVRKNSFNQNSILYDEHVKWFSSKVNDPNYYFYLFFDQTDTPVGQVRIEKSGKETIIDISMDKSFRGLSLGALMLEDACSDYLKKFPEEVICSLVKKENIASYSIFKKVNFVDVSQVSIQGQDIYKLCRRS